MSTYSCYDNDLTPRYREAQRKVRMNGTSLGELVPGFAIVRTNGFHYLVCHPSRLSLLGFTRPSFHLISPCSLLEQSCRGSTKNQQLPGTFGRVLGPPGRSLLSVSTTAVARTPFSTSMEHRGADNTKILQNERGTLENGRHQYIKHGEQMLVRVTKTSISLQD